MTEVDSVFTIKQLYSNIEIARAFLASKGINDPALLLEYLTNSGGLRTKTPQKSSSSKSSSSDITLENVLFSSFKEASDPKKVGRLKKYRMHSELLLDELKKDGGKNPFHNKIPILINGLCVTDYRSGKKSGIDPYSNSHLFSTLFIEAVSGLFPLKFLDMFRLVYVQPVPYIQKPIIREEGEAGNTQELTSNTRELESELIATDNEFICLEDILRYRIETEINPQIHANGSIGFGTLVKSDDITPKRGNSVYDPALLSLKSIQQVIISSPELVSSDATFDGVIDLDKYLELKRYEIHLNTQILAIKFAQILDLIFPHVIGIMKEYGIKGIPLYMEKTSDSARVIENTVAYSETPLRFHFIGGEEGILANTPELMPFMGICHPTAIGRLLGFIENVYMTWTKQFVKSARKTGRPKEIINVVRYKSVDEYPFFLLENGTSDRHPNMHDLAREILSEDEARHVREFAYTHRIGFSRIEPRIVELLTRDTSIYCGLRTMDKSNRRWLGELEGKKIITPDMIHGFFEMPSIKNARANEANEKVDGDVSANASASANANANASANANANASASQAGKEGGLKRIKSDFRGSEFSLPTCPKLDRRWFAKYYNSVIGTDNHSDTGDSLDTGCSIEKIITSMHTAKRKALLREQLSKEAEKGAQDVVDEFFRTHTQEMESMFAIRGTAIHKISSAPLDKLVHYETLRKAGIEPRTSDCYTETPFLHTITQKDLCYLKDNADLKHRIVKPFTVSIHPDAYFFLEREDTYTDEEKSSGKSDSEKINNKKVNNGKTITKNYDLVIIDTKTNRVTPYPEHKYILQTFFYGWLIKHIVEEELGLCGQCVNGENKQSEQNTEKVKVHNIYTVLNKNAFYRGFYNKGDAKKEEPMPHATYREQKFSPITLFTPDDVMHEVILNMLCSIVEEKNGLQQGAICFSDYKSQQEKTGRCEKCYMEHQLVCKLMKEKGMN